MSPSADDIVVFVTNLGTSINALCQLLNEFGQFSGYKVNITKSALLLLNREERESPQSHVQFATAPGGFTYLGIKITQDIENIISINYDPLLKEVGEFDAYFYDRTY